MAVNDVLQVTLVQSLHGSQVLNVLFYVVDAVGAGVAEIALAQELGENVAPALKALMAPDWAYVATIGQRIWPLPRTFPFIDTTDAGIGTNTSDEALPAQNTLNLTKTTQFAGTAWRGRVCLSGLPISASVNGLWTSGTITLAGAVASVLQADQSTGSWLFSPVLWHRPGSDVPSRDNTFTRCDDFVARSTVRAQRRRQVGKGS